MTLAVQPATDRDRAAITALLVGRGLPLDGLDGVWRTWVAREGGRVVGTASLERHQDALLLRSVAVVPDRAARGVGSALVTAALAAADPIGPVALLTETAAGWFPRFGFAATTREALPAALAASPSCAAPAPPPPRPCCDQRHHHGVRRSTATQARRREQDDRGRA